MGMGRSCPELDAQLMFEPGELRARAGLYIKKYL
jgi:hypothetical protein